MTSITTTSQSAAASAWRVRLIGLAIALVCAVPLGIALWLTPSAGGEGTHEQLGLPPCSTLMYTGWPCPTCGWTTTFALTMHGEPLKAILVQPVGALVSFGCIAALFGGLYMLWTGISLWPRVSGLFTRSSLLWLAVIALLSWAYKAALVKGVL